MTQFPVLFCTSSQTMCEIIKQAIDASKSLHVISAFDANTALKLALNEGVSVILLDMKNPLRVGDESLYDFFGGLNATKRIPIITMYSKGSNMVFRDFDVSKPYPLSRLVEKIERLLTVLHPYFDSRDEIEHFVSSLVLALESKDEYSKNHSARVAKYAALLARDMGFDEDFVSHVFVASLFHDLGKIGIPDQILTKPKKLTNNEFEIIMKHPEKSERICSPIKSFQKILPIIRAHHERFDGTGYPDELKGEGIPLESRIIAVADSFDALTSNRSYRHAFNLARVMEILESHRNTQWDGEIVDLFVKNFDEARIVRELQKPSPEFTTAENLIVGTIFNKVA